MNPFILLLKPMIAVGTYIMKLIVAGGMVVAQGMQGGPPQAGVETEAPIVRVVLSPEDGSLSQMEVQLPNGEFYQLSDVRFEETSTAEPLAPHRMAGRGSSRAAHAQTSSGTVAMLASESGHTMKCNVSLPSSSNDGSGTCMKDTGEKYEFSL